MLKYVKIQMIHVSIILKEYYKVHDLVLLKCNFYMVYYFFEINFLILNNELLLDF